MCINLVEYSKILTFSSHQEWEKSHIDSAAICVVNVIKAQNQPWDSLYFVIYLLIWTIKQYYSVEMSFYHRFINCLRYILIKFVMYINQATFISAMFTSVMA